MGITRECHVEILKLLLEGGASQFNSFCFMLILIYHWKGFIWTAIAVGSIQFWTHSWLQVYIWLLAVPNLNALNFYVFIFSFKMMKTHFYVIGEGYLFFICWNDTKIAYSAMVGDEELLCMVDSQNLCDFAKIRRKMCPNK